MSPAFAGSFFITSSIWEAHYFTIIILNSVQFSSVAQSCLTLCVPFSSYPQFLPASGSFPMSQLFTWGGQSIGVSGLASVLLIHWKDWSPLGWTGWISLQSKGRSRVFSTITVQKHQWYTSIFKKFLLEYSWFTMLSRCQVYSNLNQLHIYIYPLFLDTFHR